MKLKIDSVNAIEGDLYQVWSEDCPINCYYTSIVVEVGGKQLVSKTLGVPGHCESPDGFNIPNWQAKEQAERLVQKVRARGVIDTQYWEELPEKPSLEARFAFYAWEENQERLGLRDERMRHA